MGKETEPVILSAVRTPLTWKNQPLSSAVNDGGQLSITAGPETDWFIDPAGGIIKSDAPIALFALPDESFWLKARVTVNFESTFDAGVLFLYENDSLWAKLCFEFSPQRQPMIVSVVTRGLSDDCNSVSINGNSVYLRIHRRDEIIAFHYSLDGSTWHFVRYFSLGKLEQMRVGFSVQSPTGKSCQASFAEIDYSPGILADLRNGQ
jgi:regulation of enolase protein 1 (concanavalin A-like superfamily)